jgi:mannose-6-phosphate isomerase-like protein (cupin superfamily)
MGAVFELDHGEIAADPRFGIMVRELSDQSKIDSRASFNRYCRDACRLWNEHFGHGLGKTSSLFADLLRRVERGGDGVIQTPWGGVVITLHEHPRVNKYLVVRKGGYLALETHEEKDERLEVQEGSGLILSRRASDQPLTVQVLEPGDQFHFEPGMEHCLIGTENLLVFERSIDPKGMDQDLVFIYEPDGSEPETASVVATAKGEA